MGSRCGTLRYVPFKETWPPVENNLGGPYWERKLAGKGVHSTGYTSLFGEESSGLRGGFDPSVARGDSGVGSGILATVLVVMGVLFCCIMAIARCAGSDAGTNGRRFVVPRKARTKGRAFRLTSVVGDKDTI